MASNLITGLILAGGQASRMHNQDKGLLLLHGQPLIQHVITRLASQVSSIIINANRNLDKYAEFGYPVYPDLHFPLAGPLAGLEAGLHYCKTPYLMTVPCDSPFLPLDLAKRLMEAMEEQGTDIAIATTAGVAPLFPHGRGAGGEGSKFRSDLTSLLDQPVFCLLKTTKHSQLQDYLINGGRKMRDWYENTPVTRVYFADESAFKNINTPEELRACMLIS